MIILLTKCALLFKYPRRYRVAVLSHHSHEALVSTLAAKRGDARGQRKNLMMMRIDLPLVVVLFEHFYGFRVLKGGGTMLLGALVLPRSWSSSMRGSLLIIDTSPQPASASLGNLAGVPSI